MSKDKGSVRWGKVFSLERRWLRRDVTETCETRAVSKDWLLIVRHRTRKGDVMGWAVG